MKIRDFVWFFDHFSITKNRHAGMWIEFLMSHMASGNQNLISGCVTKAIQEIDQKHRIFCMKIRDFGWFFDHFSIAKNRHAGLWIEFLMWHMASGNQILISGCVTKDIQEMDQKHRIPWKYVIFDGFLFISWSIAKAACWFFVAQKAPRSVGFAPCSTDYAQLQNLVESKNVFYTLYYLNY